MRYCIGIDLGGTNIAGGLADLDGRLLLTDSVPTGLPCTALPSPSPANCRVPFDALVEAYGVLRPEPARDTARI